jgi:hypothetical protein
MQSSHPEHFSALSAVQAAEVQAEKTSFILVLLSVHARGRIAA